MERQLAATVLAHLRNETSACAAVEQAFADSMALHAQRVIDGVEATQEATASADGGGVAAVRERRLGERLYALYAQVCSALLGIIQQGLFARSARESYARLNAWRLVARILRYAPAPAAATRGGDDGRSARRKARRRTRRKRTAAAVDAETSSPNHVAVDANAMVVVAMDVDAVRAAVARRLWRRYGWVYFCEIAFYLVRRRRDMVRHAATAAATAAATVDDADAAALLDHDGREAHDGDVIGVQRRARDCEALLLMCALLRDVLRSVPPGAVAEQLVETHAPDSSAAGAACACPDHRRHGRHGAVVPDADAHALMVAAYRAWCERDDGGEGRARALHLRRPSYDWLDWMLAREPTRVRTWIMPATHAMAFGSGATPAGANVRGGAGFATSDIVLAETDRAAYESRLLEALCHDVRLCDEARPLDIARVPPPSLLVCEREREWAPPATARAPWLALLPPHPARPCASDADAIYVPPFLLADQGAVECLRAGTREPLAPDDLEPLLDTLLRQDATLLHRSNLSGSELVALAERQPAAFVVPIARRLLWCSSGGRRRWGAEYRDALARMPVTLSSISLVHCLAHRELFRLFASNAARRVLDGAASAVAERQHASRVAASLLARLVLRVLDDEDGRTPALGDDKRPAVDDAAHGELEASAAAASHSSSTSFVTAALCAELETFCVSMSRVSDVAALYRRLRRRQLAPDGDEAAEDARRHGASAR